MRVTCLVYIHNDKCTPDSHSLFSCELSVRDLLSWVHFMNTTSPPLTPAEAFYHGAHLVFLDGLGCSGQITGADKEEALVATQLFLQDLLTQIDCDTASQQSSNDISAAGDQFGIHPFFIRKGSSPAYTKTHLPRKVFPCIYTNFCHYIA